MMGLQIWKKLVAANMVKWPSPLSRHYAHGAGQSFNYYQHIDRLTAENVRFP